MSAKTPQTSQSMAPRPGGLLRLAAAASIGALATFAVLHFTGSLGEDPLPEARPPVEQPAAGTTRGDAQQAVEIVVYSDFQCPFCARQQVALARLQREQGDAVRLEFRHLPHPSHTAGIGAHRAALAAERQGQFWQMHDLLFANPQRLTRDAFLEYAAQIGLDVRRFEVDLDDPALDRALERDRAAAQRIGVTEAPALVVDDKVIPGAQPYAMLLRLVAEARAGGGDLGQPAMLADPRVREWVAVSREGAAR